MSVYLCIRTYVHMCIDVHHGYVAQISTYTYILHTYVGVSTFMYIVCGHLIYLQTSVCVCTFCLYVVGSRQSQDEVAS